MPTTKILIEIELGARPSEREMEVVDILVLHVIPKRHVKFLRASRTKGSKTPDLMIDNEKWEIKSLDKLGKYTLEHALRAGLKQSSNLIIDLRKLSIELEKKARREVEKEFLRNKSWKGLLVVVRYDGEVLTFHK